MLDRKHHTSDINKIEVLANSSYIHLMMTPVDDFRLKQIIEVITSKNCPPQLTVLVSNEFLDILLKHKKKCTSGVNLIFTTKNNNNELSKIADLLKSGWCPNDFCVDVDGIQITREIMLEFCDALISGKCPSGLQLKFRHCDIEEEAVTELAESLKNENCPPAISIDLTNITDEEGSASINVFANVIAHENCPKNAKFILAENILNLKEDEEDEEDEGAENLADQFFAVLKKRKNTNNIYVDISKCGVDDVIFDSSLSPGLTVKTRASSNTTAELDKANRDPHLIFGVKGIDEFIASAHGIILDLTLAHINESNLEQLLTLITNQNLHLKIDIILNFNVTNKLLDLLSKVENKIANSVQITVTTKNQNNELIQIAELLKNGLSPHNFCVDVDGIRIRNEIMKQFHAALISGKCHPGLQLKFRNCDISVKALSTLASSLLNQKKEGIIMPANTVCPPGLYIDVSNITDQEGSSSILLFSDVIANDYCCEDLTLILSNNILELEDIRKFNHALEKRTRKNNITIDFSNSTYEVDFNLSHAEGCRSMFLEFIEMLENNICPPAISLDLRNNEILFDDDMRDAIKKAMMKNTFCIQLNLTYDPKSPEDLALQKTVEHCCLRNKLIQEYPHYEAYIKKISYDAGLYIPGNKPIASLTLKSLAGATVVNFLSTNPSEQTQINNMPQDIQDYLNQLQELKFQLLSHTKYKRKQISPL